MHIKSLFRYGLRILPACFLFVTLSCGQKEPCVGTYIADAGDTPRRSETTLELKENGAGLWKVGDDEVAFSWYMKGDQLRVNTRSGGVIVGSLEKNVIRITLPGTSEMSFKRIK